MTEPESEPVQRVRDGEAPHRSCGPGAGLESLWLTTQTEELLTAELKPKGLTVTEKNIYILRKCETQKVGGILQSDRGSTSVLSTYQVPGHTPPRSCFIQGGDGQINMCNAQVVISTSKKYKAE